MSVFVDTSGLLALLDTDDLNHKHARTLWTELIDTEAELFSTSYVVVETISLIHRRFGVSTVRRFTEDLLPVIMLDWVDEAAHFQAVAAVMSGGTRGPSLVDNVSFEYMRRRGLQEALAFDAHFEERGYRVPERSIEG
jgi:Predicted nucleic acid-binding protein, contains PIN domain